MILLSYVLFILKVYFWLFSWSLLFIFVIPTEQTNSQVFQVLFKNEKFPTKSRLKILSDLRFSRYGWSDTKIAGWIAKN